MINNIENRDSYQNIKPLYKGAGNNRSTSLDIGWTNTLGHPPFSNDFLIACVFDSSRTYYGSFANYLADNYNLTPQTRNFFSRIPDSSATKALDALKRYGNGLSVNFANFNEDEKKLYLILIGNLLSAMHVGNNRQPPYVPYGEMGSRLQKFMREMRDYGESAITVGDCSQIHTFLAKQAEELGFSAHTASVMSRGLHLITFLQGADKNIYLLDYSTLYPTNTGDLQKALLTYEKNYYPKPEGYFIYNSDEKIAGHIRTKTNEQIDEVLNDNKATSYLSADQKKYDGLNIAISNYKEQVRYDQSGKFFDFGLGATNYIGKWDDVYKDLYGGYLQGAGHLNYGLYTSGDLQLTGLTELMLNGGGFHIAMQQNNNYADYFGALSYLKQQFILSRNALEFGLGGILKGGYYIYQTNYHAPSSQETLTEKDNYLRPLELAYNLQLKYRFGDEAKSEVFGNFISQGLVYNMDSQESEVGLARDERIFELGLRTRLLGTPAEFLFSYEDHPFFNTYQGKVGLTYNNYKLDLNYKNQQSNCGFVEDKYGAGVEIGYQLAAQNKEYIYLNIQKDLLTSYPEISVGYNLQF